MLPSDARIWIYQSNRMLTPSEEIQIGNRTAHFIDSWTAHNKELAGSFEIRHSIFLIMMIDEKHSNASGCSIDKSLHFIQSLEKEFGITLTDRQIFAYRMENDIRLSRRNEFEVLIQAGTITDETIIFNNLVNTKGDLEKTWEVPYRNSWHRLLAGGTQPISS